MLHENQRVALTKKLLSDGLLRILTSKSLDKVSISELCRESEINRATFYRHFETPRDVLHSLQRDFANKINRAFEKRQNLESTDKYLENLCSYLHENAELLKTFLKNNIEDEISRALSSLFSRILSDKSNGSTVSTLHSVYASGGGYSLLRHWLLEEEKRTPKEMSEIISKFFQQEPLHTF